METFSSSPSFFLDLDRDLWQMAALPVPKWTVVQGFLLAPLGPSARVLLNKEHPTACHAFVRCWCRSSSSLYRPVSYLAHFLAISGSWPPPLSPLCFVEIAYQKIAAQQLSSDCAFLFCTSRAPSPYLSFITSQLSDFFLCFASGSLFVAFGPFRYFCPLDRCRSGEAHATYSLLFFFFLPSHLHIPIWTGIVLRHMLPFLSSFLPQALQTGVLVPLDFAFHSAMFNLFAVKLKHPEYANVQPVKCFN